jgi:hypothetical protein
MHGAYSVTFLIISEVQNFILKDHKNAFSPKSTRTHTQIMNC